VATTVPNFARGTLIPVTFLFTEITPRWFTAPTTAAFLGVLCFAISLFSVLTIEETYGKDLDYLEMKLVESPAHKDSAEEVFEIGHNKSSQK
jgi:putative MFS transporter